MQKAPKMPKLPPEDGIERYKAYTRLNPSGHKELVVDDDEETLNELAESLNECAEMLIWNYVNANLSPEILNRPGVKDEIDDAIGRGAGPEEIIGMFNESIAFGGGLATGGGAGSPEQLQADRRHNTFTPELVGSSGDQTREAGEDVNNFTSSTTQLADGPEQSRAKSKIKTSTIRGIGPRNKYIAGHSGDGLDYGATHSESFTGTGAIAISPGGYNLVDDDEDDEDQNPDEMQTENNMTRRNDALAKNIDKLLNEWEPSFKSGDYSPGEYQMPSPTGDGVAKRKPKKDKVGFYDTNTSQNGKEWPRKHKTTDAMQGVGDDGTDEGSCGYKNSSHAEADDGYQTATGHNWPDEAKNSGGGVAEPFEGDRWSDGGTLKGSGQNELDNAGIDQKMPSTGPITGISGPQLGQPQEGWNPRDIGTMMEGGFDLQSLFDSYSRDYEMVCVEDFQALCNAHGAGVTLDERSLLQLMETNQQFIFYHGEDANGPYWCPTAISESASKDDAPLWNQDRPYVNSTGVSPRHVLNPKGLPSDEFEQYGSCGNTDGALTDYCRSCGRWRQCDPGDPAFTNDDGICSKCANNEKYDTWHESSSSSPSLLGDVAPKGWEADFEKKYGYAPDKDEIEFRKEQARRDSMKKEGNRMDMRRGGLLSSTTNTPLESRRRTRQQIVEGENRRPFGRTISELQIRSPEAEANPSYDADQGMDDFDLEGDFEGDSGQFVSEFFPGCQECGAPGTGEESCAECGAEMGMGSEEDMFGPGDPSRVSGIGTPDDVDLDDEWSKGPEAGSISRQGYENEIKFGSDQSDSSYDRNGFPTSPSLHTRGDRGEMESRIVNSPRIMESLHNFMHSARRILENNQEFNPQHIGEALRYSWAFHANRINPRTTPTKIRATLEGLAKRFPAFAMVMESGSDAMGSSDGTAIGTGGSGSNHSNYLPKTDTEMNDEGEPLGASQENDLDGTPEIKGTAKGMDGKGSVPQAVKENVARLSHHVQKAIKEGARSLRGKYGVRFSIVVKEGKTRNHTPIRTRLAEALADAEEILQFHRANDVELEATFSDSKGMVVLKHDVPLLTIKPRGILASEGAALFRFQRNAERFANELVAEGVTCRIVGHNWGSAVKAKAPRSIAEGAFRTLRLGKRKKN